MMVWISVCVEIYKIDNAVKLLPEKNYWHGSSSADGEVVVSKVANLKPVSSCDGLLKTRCTVL